MAYLKKIPNDKHQNSNKSQITNFNVQNISRYCLLSFRRPRSTDNYAIVNMDYRWLGLVF
ncbi:hypothetical protein D1AOALGA4SA_16 [Olavius algarvensis Delta 1 endosymbiont]|nr:hypothetical protein D1AOALGA4SA_16 [Olavius algarvensis Delta 1 endosymbiont]